mgnify:CR=1 FL=1
MRDCTAQKDTNHGMYAGFKKMVKEKSLLDMDLLFDKYPNEYFPFDYDTYFESESECEMVVTNLKTGKAEYLAGADTPVRLFPVFALNAKLPVYSQISRCELRDEPFEKTPKLSIKRFMYN